MYVLKRATSKFPSDLSVWLAYVEYASRERMRKVVLKGLNTALQHHPLSSTPYLLLSYHHLHPNSPFPRTVIPSSSKQDLPSVAAEQESPSSLEGIPTARTTLLLGLRLLPKSRELWREYIKLELGWVEGLRRRWVALGIKEEVKQPDAVLEDDRALLGGSGAFGPDGESARRAILAGQLVIYALASALEAIPIQEGELEQEKGGMAFRSGLLQLFRTYPSPLRTKCLEVVYADLDVAASLASSAGETSAHAALAVLTKRLYDRPYDSSVRDTGSVVLEGVELVEEVGLIGKAIRKTAKTGDETFGEVAGHWLAKQMEECSQQDNEELVCLSTSFCVGAYDTALIPLLRLDCLDESLPKALPKPPAVASRSDSPIARGWSSFYPRGSPSACRALPFESRHPAYPPTRGSQEWR